MLVEVGQDGMSGELQELVLSHREERLTQSPTFSLLAPYACFNLIIHLQFSLSDFIQVNLNVATEVCAGTDKSDDHGKCIVLLI